jgi:hypothetical protein
VRRNKIWVCRMPDRPIDIGARRLRVYPYDSTLVLVGAETEAAMSRKLVWIELKSFRGFGCSECGWRFKPSGAPEGKSFDEMMRNFELRRDKEFESHVCADHAVHKNPG